MLNEIKKIYRRHLLSVGIVIVSGLSPCHIVADTPENIYLNSCAFCHSRPIPPFPGPELRGRKLEPDYIKTLARRGAKGMLTFTKAEISDEELDALAKWLQVSQFPTNRGQK